MPNPATALSPTRPPTGAPAPARPSGRCGWGWRLWRPLALGLAGVWASACSPALDWRAVQPAGTPLTVWLPCKADQGAREVPLAGPAAPPVTLQMAGCRAAGRTFSVAVVALPTAGAAGAEVAPRWIDVWQRAHWAALGVQAEDGGPPPAWQAVPCIAPGATVAHCWRGSGRDGDGQALPAELHWASDGRWLVQLAVLGPALDAQAHELFFAGLRWR
ncbi:hypothetical protein [Tepidimonas charontis]|uniref:Uncharacterized protein n=1 Tax=Tepidimonas charontis TaxID=2267262 RepID=A0A554X4B1_9BURK|nr:hypothetical protein [Tepidimonas charontis]TSE30677.1 hypothetical protein Tchar_02404 [Tepidimonas charontis]